MAESQGLPLAAVLRWSRPQLQEAIASVLVDTAAQIARSVAAKDREPLAGDDTLARATRAIVETIEAQERERKARENDKVFAELIAQGAFGG